MLINQRELCRLVNIKNITENGILGIVLKHLIKLSHLPALNHLPTEEVLSDRHSLSHNLEGGESYIK